MIFGGLTIVVFCGVSVVIPWCFRDVQESLGRKEFWGA